MPEPTKEETLAGYKAQLSGERESHLRHVAQHRVELDIVVARAEAAEAQVERLAEAIREALGYWQVRSSPLGGAVLRRALEALVPDAGQEER